MRALRERRARRGARRRRRPLLRERPRERDPDALAGAAAQPARRRRGGPRPQAARRRRAGRRPGLRADRRERRGRRRGDTRRDGGPERLRPRRRTPTSLVPRFGHSHAASDLVHVAAAALSLHHRRLPGRKALAAGRPLRPRGARRGCGRPVGSGSRKPKGTRAAAEDDGPRLRCFAGPDRAAVIDALRSGREGLGEEAGARLVLVATERLLRKRAGARPGAPRDASSRRSRGSTSASGRWTASVAFVFAGAGAAYRGMGRDLARAAARARGRARAPQPEALRARSPGPSRTTPASRRSSSSSGARRRSASSTLELTRGFLGIEPHAWMGYSSGETNALLASGTWTDADALVARERELGALHARPRRELRGRRSGVGRPGPLGVLDHPRSRRRRDGRPRPRGEGPPRDRPRRRGVRHLRRRGGVRPASSRRSERDRACASATRSRSTSPSSTRSARSGSRSTAGRRRRPPGGVAPPARFYTNATGGAYAPTSESCAHAILGQANRTLDLRPTVLAAWEDGVRVFVEHGPQAACGRWIRSDPRRARGARREPRPEGTGIRGDPRRDRGARRRGRADAHRGPRRARRAAPRRGSCARDRPVPDLPVAPSAGRDPAPPGAPRRGRSAERPSSWPRRRPCRRSSTRTGVLAGPRRRGRRLASMPVRPRRSRRRPVRIVRPPPPPRRPRGLPRARRPALAHPAGLRPLAAGPARAFPLDAWGGRGDASSTRRAWRERPRAFPVPRLSPAAPCATPRRCPGGSAGSPPAPAISAARLATPRARRRAPSAPASTAASSRSTPAAASPRSSVRASRRRTATTGRCGCPSRRCCSPTASSASTAEPASMGKGTIWTETDVDARTPGTCTRGACRRAS